MGEQDALSKLEDDEIQMTDEVPIGDEPVKKFLLNIVLHHR